MGATWAPQMSVGARENKPIERDLKVREISHEIWSITNIIDLLRTKGIII